MDDILKVLRKENTMRQMKIMIALLTLGSAACAMADSHGADDFQQYCAECHSDPTLHKNKLGPSLAGVVGRHAGTADGFQYSDAMKKADLTWTPELLDRFLTDPRSVVPDNKMSEMGYPGVSDAHDRAEIIQYLSES